MPQFNSSVYYCDLLVVMISVAQCTEASQIMRNMVKYQVAVGYHIVEGFQLSDVHDIETDAFQDFICSLVKLSRRSNQYKTKTSDYIPSWQG